MPTPSKCPDGILPGISWRRLSTNLHVFQDLLDYERHMLVAQRLALMSAGRPLLLLLHAPGGGKNRLGRRWPVAQRALRPLRIVVPPSPSCQDPSLQKRVQQLRAHRLVPQLPVGRRNMTISRCCHAKVTAHREKPSSALFNASSPPLHRRGPRGTPDTGMHRCGAGASRQRPERVAGAASRRSRALALAIPRIRKKMRNLRAAGASN